MRNGALYSVLVLWFCLLTLYPSPSNLPEAAPEVKTVAGEGLFKSQLTKANLGLLGVEFFEANEGRKNWSIKSEFAELERKENLAFLQKVDAEFYASKTGNMVRTLSDYGKSQIDKEIVELSGKVKILSKKGYQFSMARLNYRGKTHEFLSDDLVQVKGPNASAPSMFLQGTGLNADIDREHFILRRQVTAQKRLRGNEWLRIQGRKGEFFTDEQRAVFVSNTRAWLPKVQIDSDVLEVTLEKENESLFARGNVVLRNRDRTGYAENAYLGVGNNKIVLEGRAKIESKDNQVTGRRITIYTDDDKIEVEQAQGRVKN